jgi:hypothetical protein
MSVNGVFACYTSDINVTKKRHKLPVVKAAEAAPADRLRELGLEYGLLRRTTMFLNGWGRAADTQ